MNYAESDLKFKITTTIDSFTLADDDFEISIKNWLGQTKYTVSKENCFVDSDGNYYFALYGVSNGTLYAYFRGVVADEDLVERKRNITDEQKLCSVGQCDCGCQTSATSKCTCTHYVEYTQVYTSSISGVEYLCDSEGNYITDSEGNRIEFSN